MNYEISDTAYTKYIANLFLVIHPSIFVTIFPKTLQDIIQGIHPRKGKKLSFPLNFVSKHDPMYYIVAIEHINRFNLTQSLKKVCLTGYKKEIIKSF